MSTWSRKESDLLKDIINRSESFEEVYSHFPNRSRASIRYKALQVSDKILINLNPKKQKDKLGKKPISSNQRYSNLLSQAKKRNLICEITKEEHIELLSSNKCAYCCQSINLTGSSLDRKDNNQGYTRENVVPCCRSCNTIKGNNLSYEEMLIMMRAIQDFRNQK